MNEKIKRLIEELKQECSEREGTAFVISTIDLSKGDATISFGGAQSEIGFALIRATEAYTDTVKKDPCLCPACQAVRSIMGIDIYEHSEIEVDEATFNAFTNGGESDE